MSAYLQFSVPMALMVVAHLIGSVLTAYVVPLVILSPILMDAHQDTSVLMALAGLCVRNLILAQKGMSVSMASAAHCLDVAKRMIAHPTTNASTDFVSRFVQRILSVLMDSAASMDIA